MIRPLIPFALLLLGACATQTQATSGAEYLARAPKLPAAETRSFTSAGATDDVTEKISIVSTDELVRRAADIEPVLQLPARIGLARIEGGHLTPVPAGEGEIWRSAAEKHPGIGTFVAIDPFVADFALASVLPTDTRRRHRDSKSTISRIRVGAARQHVDAVLIYEIGTAGWRDRKIPGLQPVQVLGRLNDRITPSGAAKAILMDVRNGYPYATMTRRSKIDDLVPSIWDDRGEENAYQLATSRIVKDLRDETERTLIAIAAQQHARQRRK